MSCFGCFRRGDAVVVEVTEGVGDWGGDGLFCWGLVERKVPENSEILSLCPP